MYGIPTDTNEQWTNPGCLGCIGGEILPFVIGFIKNPIIEIPMKNSQYTLPKTNRTSHLKMDGWNLESHLQVFIRWCWGWETIPKGENSCWITWKIHGFLLQQKLHQFSRHFQKVDVYNVIKKLRRANRICRVVRFRWDFHSDVHWIYRNDHSREQHNLSIRMYECGTIC